MNKFLKSVKKGFTLVELVVVIAIIAILAAVSVGGYFIYIGQAQQAELTTMKAEVITLVKSFTVAKTYEGVTFTYGTSGLSYTKVAGSQGVTAALKAVIDENHSASEKDKDDGFVAVYTFVEDKTKVDALTSGTKDGIVSDTKIVSEAFKKTANIVRGICAVTTATAVTSVWFVSSYGQAISIVL